MNRLTTATYGEGTNISSNANHFTEKVTGYDKNGNLTKDLNKNITGIQYNCLNLPSKVTFGNGNTITYLYAADGTKLRTVHKTGSTTTTTDYCGNVVYENGSQKYLLTEEGYVTLADSKYHYYLKDYQGNNRVVISSTGTVEETNHYYPFGGLFAATNNVQPYKYNGKEFDNKNGLNWYDYGARHYDATLGRFVTVDRFAEKYPLLSPYQYGANNPINIVDINGDSLKVMNVEIVDAIYHGLKDGNNVTMKWNNGILDPNSIKDQAINSDDFFLKDLYEIANSKNMVEINLSDKNTYQINGNVITENWSAPYDDSDEILSQKMRNSLIEMGYPVGTHIQGNLGQTLVPTNQSLSGKRSTNGNVQIIINKQGSLNHRTVGLAHEFGHVILFLNNKPYGHTQPGVDDFVYGRATMMSKRLGYDY